MTDGDVSLTLDLNNLAALSSTHFNATSRMALYETTNTSTGYLTLLNLGTYLAGTSGILTADVNGRLGIGDDRVTEVKLDIFNDPSADMVLGYTATNGMEWVAQTGGGGGTGDITAVNTNNLSGLAAAIPLATYP